MAQYIIKKTTLAVAIDYKAGRFTTEIYDLDHDTSQPIGRSVQEDLYISMGKAFVNALEILTEKPVKSRLAVYEKPRKKADKQEQKS